MDPIRALQIYVVQLGSGIFYLIISLLVLRRDTKRLNQIFSAFFLSVFIGAVLNVIYAPLNNNPTVLILHFLTLYFFTFGFIFLLIFNLIILLSEKRMTSQKQFIIIIIYGIILASLFFIPEGIKIDNSTEWKPVWNLLFLISVYLILSIMTCLTLFIEIRILKEMDDSIIKRRFKFFIFGALAYQVYSFFPPLSNFFNESTFRLFVSSLGLILLLISAPVMYYGVGKQLEK